MCQNRSKNKQFKRNVRTEEEFNKKRKKKLAVDFQINKNWQFASKALAKHSIEAYPQKSNANSIVPITDSFLINHIRSSDSLSCK